MATLAIGHHTTSDDSTLYRTVSERFQTPLPVRTHAVYIDVSYREEGCLKTPARQEDAAELQRWDETCPLKRLRAYLEANGRWSEEQEKQAKKAARVEMLSAVAAGEAKPKAPIGELFTDTFHAQPWHLQV